MSFQYLNPTFLAPQDQSLLTNLTYTVEGSRLDQQVWGSNGLSSLVFFGTATVNTPSNKQWASTEVNATTDKVTTATAHGLFTGLAVTVTQQGTLPTGLATSTTYYIVVYSATVFGFASSLANAKAGTLIDLTDVGAGNNTVVPTAISGCSVALRGTFDGGTNWVVIPNTTVPITATASFVIELDYIRYKTIQPYFVITSGSVALSPCQIGYQ